MPWRSNSTPYLLGCPRPRPRPRLYRPIHYLYHLLAPPLARFSPVWPHSDLSVMTRTRPPQGHHQCLLLRLPEASLLQMTPPTASDLPPPWSLLHLCLHLHRHRPPLQPLYYHWTTLGADSTQGYRQGCLRDCLPQSPRLLRNYPWLSLARKESAP